eukprot:CAMPEP_0196570702 /NCGR_PEP_ID=MMETSP1081-20130531/860_1 /TAXON_ID=36882 /ORGANISM="Pyramimonas amylifera, Strain CCMP720" /LENGTH=179 /DNA_ID=CAMNT_0041887293 /DNA_START=221 /DNA_END=760 /DNA_ORIENTATION=+
MGADTSACQSIIRVKQGIDKILETGGKKLMGAVGDGGDRVQFTEFIEANMQLYSFRNGVPLSTNATAKFIRGELATALRKGPYNANLLVGGLDAGEVSLYYIDYLATLHKMNCAAHGYGALFMYTLFDSEWKPGMSLEEAKALARKCIAEVKLRLVVAPPEFLVKIVDKDGCRVVSLEE